MEGSDEKQGWSPDEKQSWRLVIGPVVSVVILVGCVIVIPLIGHHIVDDGEWQQWMEARDENCTRCLEEHCLPSATPGDYDNFSPFMYDTCPDCKRFMLEN